MEKSPSKKRPFGLIVIIILQIISAVSLGIDFFFQDKLEWLWALPTLPGTLDFVARQLPLSAIFLIIYQLVVIGGLWFLKRWAWFLLMIGLGLSMMTQLVFYISGIPLYTYMVFSVLMVFYLNQRDVQRAFERQNPQQEAA